MTPQEIIQKTRPLLKLFKIFGRPADEMMSDGQVLIAGSIIFKASPRTACLASTGYGKSEAVAIGTILRCIVYKEDFIIASVKYGTSDIIMSKVIEHLFDDPFITYQMELDKSVKLDRLRRERKKENLTFREGGSIKIISLHGKDDDVGTAIGEHVSNIILDESPLLSATKYFQVLKILEGTGNYDNTFLFELGNAVNRNHFMNNVLHNPQYFKINISLEQAIREGRLDQKSVDEKKTMPLFESFYLNKFPDAEAIDEKGYRVLLTEEEIRQAFVDTIEDEDDKKLGADIAGGGDDNAFVVRGHKYAYIDRSNRSIDTMVNISEIEDIMEQKDIEDTAVFIDDVGIGRGVSDRLKEKGHEVNSISAGSASDEKDKFKNIKAQCYWGLRNWIKSGGKLKRDERFIQISWIKYKVTSDKQIQIEPKDDLKSRTGKSPDYAEALMLTFAPTIETGMIVL